MQRAGWHIIREAPHTWAPVASWNALLLALGPAGPAESAPQVHEGSSSWSRPLQAHREMRPSVAGVPGLTLT